MSSVAVSQDSGFYAFLVSFDINLDFPSTFVHRTKNALVLNIKTKLFSLFRKVTLKQVSADVGTDGNQRVTRW